MPFCATCGSSVEGSFCPKCGSPVGAAAPPPVYAAAPAAGGLTDNVACALCYALGLITGILFLVLAPYNQNKTIRFNAFQSIFLHVGAIVFVIGLNIIFGIMHLWELYFVTSLIWLLFFLLWLYLVIQSYQGKTVVLPVIGPIAQQQARN